LYHLAVEQESIPVARVGSGFGERSLNLGETILGEG
jgi:hypothetical protein